MMNDFLDQVRVLLPDVMFRPSYDDKRLHAEIFKPFDGYISFAVEEASGEFQPFEIDVECDTVCKDDYWRLAGIFSAFSFKQVYFSYRVPLLGGGWDYTGDLYFGSDGTGSASISLDTDDAWFNREKTHFDVRFYEEELRALTRSLTKILYGRKLKEAVTETTEAYLLRIKEFYSPSPAATNNLEDNRS